MSSQTLQALLQTYGYLALLVGTFFEGETILVMAGFLAHRGYLSLPMVILAALLGTLAGDQLFYHIGRSRGPRFLEGRPAWLEPAEKITAMLRRRRDLVILGFRFVYGLRTVTPFVIGMAGIPPLRFTLLNLASAAVWAAVVGGGGYLFGAAMEALLGDIRRHEITIMAGIVAAGGAFWLVRRLLVRSGRE